MNEKKQDFLDEKLKNKFSEMFFDSQQEEDEENTSENSNSDTVSKTDTVSDSAVSKIDTVSEISASKTDTVSDSAVSKIEAPSESDTVSKTDTVSDSDTPEGPTVSKIEVPNSDTVSNSDTPEGPTVSKIEASKIEAVSNIDTLGNAIDNDKYPEIILNILQDKNLTTTAKQIVLFLLAKRKRTVIDFSYRKIKNELGFSTSTIRDALDSVVLSDLFKIKRKPGESTKIVYNIPTVSKIETRSSSSKYYSTNYKLPRALKIKTLRIFAKASYLFGLTKENLTKKSIGIIKKSIETTGTETSLKRIYYCLNYKKTKNVRSFIYSSFMEEWGEDDISAVAEKKIDDIQEKIQLIENEGLGYFSLEALRNIAYAFGIRTSTSVDRANRTEIESAIKDELSKAEELTHLFTEDEV